MAIDNRTYRERETGLVPPTVPILTNRGIRHKVLPSRALSWKAEFLAGQSILQKIKQAELAGGNILKFAEFTPTDKSVYGFNAYDLRDYFGFGQSIAGTQRADALIRALHGETLTQAQATAFVTIDKNRFKPGATSYNQGYGDIAWGLNHLKQHPKGSHYSGDFNAGTFVNDFIGVITFGSAPDMRSFFSALGQGKFEPSKLQFNVPFSGAHVNKFTNDVGSFYTGQQFKEERDRINDSRYAKIAQTVAGAVAGYITVSGITQAANAANTGRAGTVPSGVAGTGATTTKASLTTNLGLRGLSSFSTGYKGYQISQLSQSVIAILGQKIGGALLALISGDFAQAIQIITSDPPSSTPQGPSIEYRDRTTSGGGGGGGQGVSGPSVLTPSTNLLMYGVIGFVALGLLWLLVRRK